MNIEERLKNHLSNLFLKVIIEIEQYLFDIEESLKIILDIEQIFIIENILHIKMILDIEKGLKIN